MLRSLAYSTRGKRGEVEAFVSEVHHKLKSRRGLPQRESKAALDQTPVDEPEETAESPSSGRANQER
jgi:hypothetical protein